MAVSPTIVRRPIPLTTPACERPSRGRWLATVAGVLLVACGGAEAREATTDNGHYVVRWTTEPAEIPYNALFTLDVTARTSDGAPAETLGFDATMPAHGHGMQTQPKVTAKGDGAFFVEGLMFHMRGAWDLAFTVSGPAGTDTVTFREEFR